MTIKSFVIATTASLAFSALASAHAHDHSGASEKPHCAGMPVGEGVVNGVDVKKSAVNISHGPIAALGWGEMTMDFTAAKGVDLAAFASGEKVHFLFAEKKKKWTISAMCSMDIDAGAHEACMNTMHEAAMNQAKASGKAMCPMMHGDKMDHSTHGAEGAAAKGHEGHH